MSDDLERLIRERSASRAAEQLELDQRELDAGARRRTLDVASTRLVGAYLSECRSALNRLGVPTDRRRHTVWQRRETKLRTGGTHRSAKTEGWTIPVLFVEAVPEYGARVFVGRDPSFWAIHVQRIGNGDPMDRKRWLMHNEFEPLALPTSLATPTAERRTFPLARSEVDPTELVTWSIQGSTGRDNERVSARVPFREALADGIAVLARSSGKI